MTDFRSTPDIPTLLTALRDHAVDYVVTGSYAAVLYGVDEEPGDLDITPSMERANLVRLASALTAIGARRVAEAGFGWWERQPNGEWAFVQRDATPEDLAALAAWRPDPDDPPSFDHLLESDHGAIDIVPEISGTYEELRPRAVEMQINGCAVWVEHIDDALATITVPRRAKDAERVRRLRELQRARGRQVGSQ